MVRHWESLASESAGRGSIDDNYAAQHVGRKIQERDDGKMRVEEGHTHLKVKAEFFYKEKRMVDSTNRG